MPRKPISERPMTDAERQARCRAARESGNPGSPDTATPRSPQSRQALARRCLRADHVAGSLRRLAGSSAGEPTGQRHRRRVAGDLRPRPHRTPGDRSAPRLRPRLTHATSALRTESWRQPRRLHNTTAPPNPRSPRLRNPDQLRRGERYRPRPSQGGSILDADRGSLFDAD